LPFIPAHEGASIVERQSLTERPLIRSDDASEGGGPPHLWLGEWQELWEEVHEVAERIDQRVQHTLEESPAHLTAHTLPLRQAESEGAPMDCPTVQPLSLSILVVEDDPDTAMSTAMILELLGHEVRVAHDGASAIAAVRQNQPDAVMMDIAMPGMDGYALAASLRPMLTKKPLMAAISGYVPDPERSKAAGIELHFLKPVEPDILRDVLRAHATQRHGSASWTIGGPA
jgi:CheY-like chemotaxis protein